MPRLAARRLEPALRELSAALTRRSEDVLQSLADAASRAGAIRWVALGELDERDGVALVRGLAASEDGTATAALDYALPGTPCEDVLRRNVCLVQNELARAYPSTPIVLRLGAESYVGAPLTDSEERPLGILAAMSDRPIAEPQRLRVVLELFAASASLELERRRSRQRLAASEQRFRELVEDSRQGILIVDRAGRVLFANAALAGILGWQHVEEVLGWPSFAGMLPGHEVQRVFDDLEARFAGRPAPALYDLEARRRDGAARWLTSSPRLIDWNGAPAVQASFIDVTERKESERRLASSHQRLSSQMLAMRDLIHAGRNAGGDLAGVLQTVTERLVETFECDRASVWRTVASTGSSRVYACLDLYDRRRHAHEHGRQFRRAAWRRGPPQREEVAAITSVASDPRLSPGARDFCAAHGIRSLLEAAIWGSGEGDEPAGWIALSQCDAAREWTVRDQAFATAISNYLAWLFEYRERLQTAAALAESQNRLQLVLDSTVDGIVTMSAAGRVETFNRAAQGIFGYTEGQIRGAPVSRLVPAADPEADPQWAAGLGGAGREVEGLRRDGRTVPLVLTVREMHDEAGRRHLVGTVRDVSEMKETEERLRQSQKMEAIGQLTGGIAHDFNNLLAIVLGNLQLLRRRLDDRELNLYVDQGLTAVRRGAELTERLLSFSRRQPLRPERLDLAAALSELHALLGRILPENIRVEVHVEANLVVRLDRRQLESALLNLSINARDAMPGGGALLIDARRERTPPDLCDADGPVPPGEYVVVRVSDTGTGMEPEVVARIFEPFFSTKELSGGTGLGLSMVYGFVKQSGGYVSVRSARGRGTDVRLYLPPDPAGGTVEDDASAALLESEPAGHGEVVLLVEDDADVRATTDAMLEDLGYQRLLAGDAEEALALVERGAAFDLLLTDVVLPGPRSGVDLARAVADRRPRTPVVFCSGYAAAEVFEGRGLGAGAVVLWKPFERGKLARRLRSELTRGARAS